MGDVIELVQHVDKFWYSARNANKGDSRVGLVLAKNLRIIKRLPGEDIIKGFEDGPCAVAMHEFVGRTWFRF